MTQIGNWTFSRRLFQETLVAKWDLQLSLGQNSPTRNLCVPKCLDNALKSNCHELVTKQKKKVLLSCCRDNIFNKNMPLSSLGVTTLLWQLETFPRQYWEPCWEDEGARARWSWRKPNEYKRTFYLPTYTCYATYMHPTPNYALMLLSMFAKIYTFCTLHIIS